MSPHTGPGAPPRGPRTAPVPRAHRWTALALLGALVGLGALASAQVAGSGKPHAMVGLPLPSIPCLGGNSAGRRSTPFEVPGVLIYISTACPHCRAQLQAWDHVMDDRDDIQPWVVLAPGEEADFAVIPGRLRARVARDDDARIARALDVRRVPLTLYIGGDRTVVARVEGRQGGAEMARLLADIAPLSPPHSPSPRVCP